MAEPAEPEPMMTKSASSIFDMFHEIGERNVAAARDHHNGLALHVDLAAREQPASEAAPDGSSTSFMRSKAVFIALRTAVVRRPSRRARRPCLTAAKGATPGRRAISPSQIDVGPSGMVSICRWASESAHAVEAFRLDGDQISVFGER